MKYGRLTIVRELYTDHHRSRIVECICDCGSKTKVRLQNLVGGSTVSCGCYKKQYKGRYLEPKLLNTWQGMYQRCYNAKCKDYKRYGGRGIKICNKWLQKPIGINNFMYWMLGMGWYIGCNLQLDRKNNNLGYSPKNCRLVKAKKNAWNRSEIRSRTINYKGKNYKFREFCFKFSKINPKTIYDRYFIQHWSLDDAINLTPNAALSYQNRIKGRKEMARPANPNKEKIADIKTEMKVVNKVVRAGETAAKKKARLEDRLKKLTGDETTAKAAKPAKVKADKSSKTKEKEKSAKTGKVKKEKASLDVKKKSRGRPRKVADDDED